MHIPLCIIVVLSLSDKWFFDVFVFLSYINNDAIWIAPFWLTETWLNWIHGVWTYWFNNNDYDNRNVTDILAENSQKKKNQTMILVQLNNILNYCYNLCSAMQYDHLASTFRNIVGPGPLGSGIYIVKKVL